METSRQYFTFQAKAGASTTTTGAWAFDRDDAELLALDWCVDAIRRGDTVVREGVVTVAGPGVYFTLDRSAIHPFI